MLFPLELGLENHVPALVNGADKRKWAWAQAVQTAIRVLIARRPPVKGRQFSVTGCMSW